MSQVRNRHKGMKIKPLIRFKGGSNPRTKKMSHYSKPYSFLSVSRVVTIFLVLGLEPPLNLIKGLISMPL